MRRQERYGWFFIAPFLVVFAVFMIGPLAYAFQLSLFKKTLVQANTFVGLENYLQVFVDPQFLSGITTLGAFVVIAIPIQIIFALVLALALDEFTGRWASASRLIIFVPYAVPVVIGALMWGFLYSRDFGPFTSIFEIFGLAAPAWLGSSMVVQSITNVIVWQWTGYHMVILFAAMRGIDRSLYEAARLDGAGPIQIALRIKVPLVAPALVLTTVFAIIGTLQLYTEPMVLSGAATSAITSYFTPTMYSQSLAFAGGQLNYAAAVSFVLAVVTFAGSFLFLRVTRSRSGLV